MKPIENKIKNNKEKNRGRQGLKKKSLEVPLEIFLNIIQKNQLLGELFKHLLSFFCFFLKKFRLRRDTKYLKILRCLDFNILFNNVLAFSRKKNVFDHILAKDYLSCLSTEHILNQNNTLNYLL